MTDEKTVELTEAEKDMLDAAYDSDFLGLVEVVESIVTAREIAAEQAGREDNALHEMCYVSGSKALEAREAAARREALLEAEAEANALRSQIDSAECASRCYRRELRGAEAKVARVEVLAHRARLGTVSASEITAALAEPERDEESGR